MCGDPECAKLATEVWPEMLVQGHSWSLRQMLECTVCAAERQRRCRVMMHGNQNAELHLQEPFAHAPYVHPFNAPKYHAQQLRTLNFAKATNKRVLWTIAYDKPLTAEDKTLPIETLERMRERWLELHDQNTAGIMGMLSLIHI